MDKYNTETSFQKWFSEDFKQQRLKYKIPVVTPVDSNLKIS
ncbi:hypothetical protein [Enterococcus sp. DIV0187]